MQQFPNVLEKISDLSLPQIENLLHLSQKFKRGDIPLRQGLVNDGKADQSPIVATSFLENSTRTKHSFAIAIHNLGAFYLDFNAETSSMKKGETLEETLITLAYQGVNLCIIRTSVSHQLAPFHNNPPLKIINGGDGIHQHPTQALLDLLTMIECGHNPKGKTVAIIGDLIHSRVGHSLIDLLPQFGAKIVLCGPEHFLPKDFNNPHVRLETSLEKTVKNCDLLYLLRIQKERHGSSTLLDEKEYHLNYGITLEKLNKWGGPKALYHPGPANIGVEIEHQALKSPWYYGYEQVRHSIFMRMAIIKAMLNH